MGTPRAAALVMLPQTLVLWSVAMFSASRAPDSLVIIPELDMVLMAIGVSAAICLALRIKPAREATIGIELLMVGSYVLQAVVVGMDDRVGGAFKAGFVFGTLVGIAICFWVVSLAARPWERRSHGPGYAMGYLPAGPPGVSLAPGTPGAFMAARHGALPYGPPPGSYGPPPGPVPWTPAPVSPAEPSRTPELVRAGIALVLIAVVAGITAWGGGTATTYRNETNRAFRREANWACATGEIPESAPRGAYELRRSMASILPKLEAVERRLAELSPPPAFQAGWNEALASLDRFNATLREIIDSLASGETDVLDARSADLRAHLTGFTSYGDRYDIGTCGHEGI